MKPIKILVVDDDQDIHTVYKKAVNPLTTLEFATDIKSCMDKINKNDYALILLDLYLYDENSLEWLEYYSENKPHILNKIILVTGQGELDDEIKGHTIGVRDYIKKPLNLNLLRAIIDKHLASVLNTNTNVISKGPFLIDLNKHEVIMETENQKETLDLTHNEYKLLTLLLENEGRVLTREAIWENIWDSELDVASRTVDMHISSLRKKLGVYEKNLITRRSVGYIFDLSLDNTLSAR